MSQPPETGRFYSNLYSSATGLPPPHLTGFNNIENLTGVRLGVFWEHFNDADDETRAISTHALKVGKRPGHY
jgi:hypothetical protein